MAVGMVVGLDLHQDVHRLALRARTRRRRDRGRSGPRAGPRSPRRCPCRPRARPRGCASVLRRIMRNSESLCGSPSIDELGVEDLVPAVLAVGLREHHELDVVGIAPELVGTQLDQVVDLVVARARGPWLGSRSPARRVPAPGAGSIVTRLGRLAHEELGELRSRSSTVSVMRSCSASSQRDRIAEPRPPGP